MAIGVSYTGHDGRRIDFTTDGNPAPGSDLDQIVRAPDTGRDEASSALTPLADAMRRARRPAVPDPRIDKAAGTVKLNSADHSPGTLEEKLATDGSLEASFYGLRLKGEGPGADGVYSKINGDAAYRSLDEIDNPKIKGGIVGEPDPANNLAVSNKSSGNGAFGSRIQSRTEADAVTKPGVITLYEYTRMLDVTAGRRVGELSGETKRRIADIPVGEHVVHPWQVEVVIPAKEDGDENENEPCLRVYAGIAVLDGAVLSGGEPGGMDEASGHPWYDTDRETFGGTSGYLCVISDGEGGWTLGRKTSAVGPGGSDTWRAIAEITWEEDKSPVVRQLDLGVVDFPSAGEDVPRVVHPWQVELVTGQMDGDEDIVPEEEEGEEEEEDPGPFLRVYAGLATYGSSALTASPVQKGVNTPSHLPYYDVPVSLFEADAGYLCVVGDKAGGTWSFVRKGAAIGTESSDGTGEYAAWRAIAWIEVGEDTIVKQLDLGVVDLGTDEDGEDGNDGKDAGLVVTQAAAGSSASHPNGGTTVTLQPTKDGVADGQPTSFTVWNGNDQGGGGGGGADHWGTLPASQTPVDSFSAGPDETSPAGATIEIPGAEVAAGTGSVAATITPTKRVFVVDSMGNVRQVSTMTNTAIQVRNGADGDNGVSPEVSVSDITGGHRVAITDAEHPNGQTFDVMDGADGNGVEKAETVLVSQSASGDYTVSKVKFTMDDGTTSTVNISAKNGAAGVSGRGIASVTRGQPVYSSDVTTTPVTFTFDKGSPVAQTIEVQAKNGTDGTNGDDGVSPVITVEDIDGGHRVTITDAEHPNGQTFDVMDGVDADHWGVTATDDFNTKASTLVSNGQGEAGLVTSIKAGNSRKIHFTNTWIDTSHQSNTSGGEIFRFIQQELIGYVDSKGNIYRIDMFGGQSVKTVNHISGSGSSTGAIPPDSGSYYRPTTNGLSGTSDVDNVGAVVVLPTATIDTNGYFEKQLVKLFVDTRGAIRTIKFGAKTSGFVNAGGVTGTFDFYTDPVIEVDGNGVIVTMSRYAMTISNGRITGMVAGTRYRKTIYWP